MRLRQQAKEILLEPMKLGLSFAITYEKSTIGSSLFPYVEGNSIVQMEWLNFSWRGMTRYKLYAFEEFAVAHKMGGR